MAKASFPLSALILAFIGVSFSGPYTLHGLPINPQSGKASTMEEQVALNAAWELGKYLFELGEYDAALTQFKKAADAFPGEPKAMIFLGAAYTMLGLWEEGEKSLLRGFKGHGNNKELNNLLGNFFFMQGKYRQSAPFYERSLLLSPEQDEQRIKIIKAYIRANQYKRVGHHLEALSQSRNVILEKAEIHHAYARYYHYLGNYRESLVYSLKAWESEPDNAELVYTLAMDYMRLNRYFDAIPLLKEYNRRYPSDTSVYINLGEALYFSHELVDAETVWLSGLKRFSGNYALMMKLIDLYINTARPEKAKLVLKFTSLKNPNNPNNYLVSAHYLRRMAQYGQAARSLSRYRAMTDDTMQKEGLWEEALLAYDRGHFFSSEFLTDKIIARKIRVAEAWQLKARIALALNRTEQAKISVLEAQKLNPYDLKVYRLAASAFAREKDRSLLLELFESGHSLMPHVVTLDISALAISNNQAGTLPPEQYSGGIISRPYFSR